LIALSFALTVGDIRVLSSVTVSKVSRIVSFGATFGTIFVEQARDTWAVALTTGPIVSRDCVFQLCFLLFLGSLQVSDLVGKLANHHLILSQDHVLVRAATLGLRDRVNRAS